MALTKRKAWLLAFRPHTLPLAAAGVIMGNGLAFSDHYLDYIITGLTLLTALLLQTLSNLANDYGDFKHGADTAGRVGPLRMAQHGLISPRQMKKAVFICIFLCFASGISLLIASYRHIGLTGAIVLFLLGISAIAAAIAYTATKKPYGYIGLGDISVFLFFGILSVAGAYYLQSGLLPGQELLPSAAIGLLSAAVLNVNNLRDLEADRLANKKTIANLLGEKRAKIYHWCLLLSAMILFLLYAAAVYSSTRLFLFLLPMILFIRNGIGVSRSHTPEDLRPYLKQLSLSVLAFVIVFCIGLIIYA